MDKTVYFLDNLSSFFVLGIILSVYFMLIKEIYGHRKKGVGYLNNNHRGKHLNILIATLVALTVHIGSLCAIFMVNELKVIDALGTSPVSWTAISGWVLFYVAVGHLKEERISGSADDLIWKKDKKEKI